MVRCGHASSAMTRQQRTSKGPPRDPVPRLQCLLNSHCCGDLLAAHYQRHRHHHRHCHCHCLHNILSARSLTFYYLNDVPLIIVINSGIKEGHFLVSMRKNIHRGLRLRHLLPTTLLTQNADLFNIYALR